jgi:hypothetical protein
MRLSAYDTYCLFIALKNHFTQPNYDFFKYQGKTRVSKESFLSRRDKYQFQKLCRKYDDTEIREFIIANLVNSDKSWVGDLLQDEADDIYRSFVKRQQSISYLFENEIQKAFSSVGSPEELFKVTDQLPKIIMLYLQKDISLETLIILNDFIGFFSKYDIKLQSDFLYPKIKLQADKLKPFMLYDKVRMKGILKNKIEEYHNG